MEKLKPCPFCGGEVRHEMMMDGAMSWNCSICGLQARFPNDVFGGSSSKSWNTRYQPTCRWKPWKPDWEYEGNYDTECGTAITWEPKGTPEFCPGCGACVEVVE